jgi:hypothetical protein
VKEWVRAGGSLWTDALGLSRDEANQTAAAPDEVFGVTRRSYESWGAVESYKATDIKTLQEPDAPANALVEFAVNGVRPLRVSIARETFETKTARVLARFSDGKPAIVQNQFGKGSVTLAGFWSGLTYSAKVRRTDFDMRADFDATVRDVIAEAALKRGVYRPIIPSEPLAESIVFEKDGRRCVALINWAFARGAGEANKGHLQSLTNLRLSLSGVGEVKSVRSLKHGPLALRNQTVLLPRLDEIDLLMLQ